MSARALIVVAIGIVLGVGVPVGVVRMLVPALAQGTLTTNYRGRTVFAGLGVVWLAWAASAMAMGVIGTAVLGEQSMLPVLMLAGPLAFTCFTFGLVDDAYGTGASRGFRGHLSAMKKGQLTTGGLKLLGISAAALVAAFVLAQAGPADSSAVIYAVPAGAAIALTANFVNLTDLRPARALKAYSLLGLLGVVSSVIGLGYLVDAAPVSLMIDGLVLALFVLGPVLATWTYDAGERGMLGDAGANAAGAVAGLLIVAGLPLYLMLGYLALMLALNLASEKMSFTKIIENTAGLRWLDRLGREWGEPPTDDDPRSETE